MVGPLRRWARVSDEALALGIMRLCRGACRVAWVAGGAVEGAAGAGCAGGDAAGGGGLCGSGRDGAGGGLGGLLLAVAALFGGFAE